MELNDFIEHNIVMGKCFLQTDAYMKIIGGHAKMNINTLFYKKKVYQQ